MKLWRKSLLAALLVGLGAIAALAQSGQVRLSNFGAVTLVNAGYPCVTECYFTLSQGTFTANGATPVTVTNSRVTANSTVLISLKTVGGTVGAVPAIQTITAGTGFTVAGTASDTSIYSYLVIN